MVTTHPVSHSLTALLNNTSGQEHMLECEALKERRNVHFLKDARMRRKFVLATTVQFSRALRAQTSWKQERQHFLLCTSTASTSDLSPLNTFCTADVQNKHEELFNKLRVKHTTSFSSLARTNVLISWNFVKNHCVKTKNVLNCELQKIWLLHQCLCGVLQRNHHFFI